MTCEPERPFTGERLPDEDALFGVDLVRHRAAYAYARRLADERGVERVLELGSGTGAGAADLARAGPRVVAVDRVSPGRAARSSGALFLRADVAALPLRAGRFDLVLSFQVLEHLSDPAPLLDAIARLLAPGGLALLTTPNRLESEGENPYHVHEYDADELESLLRGTFEDVELLGVLARGEARRYHEARRARIRRIVGLDPLGLRRRIPRPLVEWLFARLAVVVRRGLARGAGGLPEVDLEDFPIGPARPDALDWLALCRGPRRARMRSGGGPRRSRGPSA